jgi:hypothetical protein
MSDIKSFLGILLLGCGIFGIIMLFYLITANWEMMIHAPFINTVNPNDLLWFHYFYADDTVPYSYALCYYNPQFWWTMSIVMASIITIVIIIVLIVMIS